MKRDSKVIDTSEHGEAQNPVPATLMVVSGGADGGSTEMAGVAALAVAGKNIAAATANTNVALHIRREKAACVLTAPLTLGWGRVVPGPNQPVDLDAGYFTVTLRKAVLFASTGSVAA